MTYTRISEESNAPGHFGCGLDCTCASCRARSGQMGQWGAEEEAHRVPAPRPAGLSRTAGWDAYPFAAPSVRRLGAYLGQSPARAGAQQCASTYLGAGPTAVLDGFDFDLPKSGSLPGSALKPLHRQIVQRLAKQVVDSWSSQQPIRVIRLVGHTDPVGSDEYNQNLGGRRALAVQSALKAAIESLAPGLSGQIAFFPDSDGERCPVGDNRTREGRERNRRVEVFLRAVKPTPPPSTSPSFDPNKAAKEAAEKLEPTRPETPDERIQRILNTRLPTLPGGASFKEWLDRKMAERGVPKWLRERIWKSITDKDWGVMSDLLSQAGFSGAIKESILKTAGALMEVKVR